VAATPVAAETETATVTLTIDGRELTVPERTTIWNAARELGIDIPVACHDPRYDPVGVCRLCAPGGPPSAG
jgi:formate dehydrogenase major subunit